MAQWVRGCEHAGVAGTLRESPPKGREAGKPEGRPKKSSLTIWLRIPMMVMGNSDLIVMGVSDA
jgi:hypothetical protein